MNKLYMRIHLFAMLALFPCLVFSQTNQYLHFDKVDDYVVLNGGSQYIANSNAISLTGWFFTDALAYGQGMMGFRASNGEGFYLIQLEDGKLESRFSSSGGFYEVVGPVNTLMPQMWQHVAWVYDGTSLYLYINGVLKGSKPASGQITNANIAFAIGKSILNPYNFVFGGGIDEVSVWSVALTQNEIQGIMQNEITGTEPGLQLYYKFNQGVPGGSNTGISKLVCETGSGTRDADLMNFALTGNSSNFLGTIFVGFQAISFPQIQPKLITDTAFHLNAVATSGLAVEYEIVSGPATLNGNLLTLTGVAGSVKVKATQPGNAQYNPAAPVEQTFSVYDPATHTPEVDVRNVLAGNVYAPSLKPIQLAAIASISCPELFSVTGLHFVIDGNIIPAQQHADGHYTAWWNPPSYGSYAMQVVSGNNFGHSTTENVSFNLLADTINADVVAVQGMLINNNVSSAVVDAELPCYVGAFDKITATLQVQCPPGGCGIWDRIVHIEARSHEGEWFQIIRYITPYGVACTHNIDLTDYMSLLYGKVSFKISCSTTDTGYIYNLTLHYGGGIPPHPYSTVSRVWEAYYPFGDFANLQPVETFNFAFPANAVSSKLKLVSTGHGWGDNNTGNAAEFYDATHHIWVNNQETFEQHNWYDCQPNPDGCQPQNGTYYFNRAGWCPGAIAQWYDFSLDPYISATNMELKYIFYPDYVDFCHPNHPDCVSPTTCPNCNDGFNPALDVACNLVVFADAPIYQGVNENYSLTDPKIALYPNPSNGIFTITPLQPNTYRNAVISIMTPGGKVIEEFIWDGESRVLDLTGQPKGMYFLRVQTANGTGMKKFIVL